MLNLKKKYFIFSSPSQSALIEYCNTAVSAPRPFSPLVIFGFLPLVLCALAQGSLIPFPLSLLVFLFLMLAINLYLWKKSVFGKMEIKTFNAKKNVYCYWNMLKGLNGFTILIKVHVN